MRWNEIRINIINQFLRKRNDIGNQQFFSEYAKVTTYFPKIVIVCSTDRQIISINNETELVKLLGYTPKQTTDFKKLFSNEVNQMLTTAFNHALEGREESHEIQLNRIDGKTSFLSVTFAPIIQNKGVHRVYIIVHNITEQVELKNLAYLREKHLNYAQQIAKVGSWEYLIKEDQLFYSEYFYDLFGLEHTRHYTMDKLFKLVHPEDYERSYKFVKEAYKGKNFRNEFRIFHGKTNELRYIKVEAEVLHQNENPYKLIGVVKDFTNEKLLENALTEAIENYEYIFDNLSAGIWMRDYINGNFKFASKGLETILEVPINTLYSNSNIWKEMIHPEDKAEVTQNIGRIAMGESIQMLYRLICPSRKTKWLLEQVVPRQNAKGEIYQIFGLVSDVTKEIESQERLTYLAQYDELTGLPNLSSLNKKLDDCCKTKEAFAVLHLDIDRFHLINDSLGYHIGDEALKIITNRLKEMVPHEGYLARLNSNDFIMIIPIEGNEKVVFELADQIMEVIAQPFVVQDYEMNLSTSIGIAFYPIDGSQTLALLESAHSALYQAKRHGKNNYQPYSNSKGSTTLRKYILDRDMRMAINRQEFEVYLQPQIETQKYSIKGAEALIRWNHRELGMISPGDFIPLAEENHMIIQITDWIIEKVCSLFKDWKERGIPIFPISINVPPIRFMKYGLVDYMAKMIREYDISPEYIEFEITEGSLLRSESSVIETLHALRKLGVKIAIDDFGTGYSSLESLRKFKPDTIKIDQIFIKNIHKDNSVDQGIISSILYLGKLLGVKIIAEGVEKNEHLTFLQQNECLYIQGYLFSMPVPIKEYEKMLQEKVLKQDKKLKLKDLINEKRKHFRFELPHPVIGQMIISGVNNERVNTSSIPILLENISLGGIKFSTNYKIPVNSNINYKFEFNLCDIKVEASGDLRWFEEKCSDTYCYGVKFHMNHSIEKRIETIIRRLPVLRKGHETSFQ
ncbi:diguanylate cyclase (GGDEF)-like protein/PAS domain S-box-containing protein [Lysinibacillus composti]|uniref:EAL domain-containing protein n=1 Tax=Lysinibacillus composti TaxID=720633 RepID=A0A3N9U710_9BACI|nr:EAL domain-containing protein [Lysinibacillus composti]MBM7610377.1 diguanylate cyclase (GGDEF)-like protein/PAS domain S-box-containing protein [Lysinibacillus composti]RQW72350.1 EAL domain-containing protein [Lysinibacillus composti]